ncbi:MAG TPA: quinone-dependent dihydroorotate dehydrogenase [Pseudobdellovibrionaceae bacterium]|nr:quinone-dependent dihydroorotate dehydrogenase [Pseudobdellovibrionaceae bacterium]
MIFFKNPLLLISSTWAHKWGPVLLPLISKTFSKKEKHWDNFQWRGLEFSNRLGIAGGVDKNALNICDWVQLGAGFIEIGTVTPLPQGPNPGLILDRDIQNLALWNKMGFPNDGSDLILKRILKWKSKKNSERTPLFVNIGKNRTTEISSAFLDYVLLIKKLESVADVFVINISSPNTSNLRSLQSQENLEILIQKVRTTTQKPLLLKLSPDLTEEQLSSSLMVACKEGIDGFILTNTTTRRDGLSKFSTEGGVSGAPLKDISEQMLIKTLKILGDQRKGKLIVSVGGVMGFEDFQKRRNLGADLIEVYAALAFSGPLFFQKMAKSFMNSVK